jgi:hypothetical protein
MAIHYLLTSDVVGNNDMINIELSVNLKIATIW